MVLERMLEPVPVREFLEQYYLKLPYARAGACRHVLPLADWDVLDRILARPDADTRASRLGVLWEGGKVGSGEAARRLLAEGYTVAVRKAEEQDPGLGELAAGFRRDLLGAVDVHVYCTPAGQPGLGWHYDAEEVFILQTAGSKEWWLRRNTVHPWPLMEAMPADMRHEREIMPVMRCRLEAGDWLYIPGGYWHRTEAGAEASVSLSVGVRAAVAVDVYDWLRRELLGSIQWRQRLGLAGAGDGRGLREVLAELGKDLADRLGREETARAFGEEWRRKYGGEGARDPG